MHLQPLGSDLASVVLFLEDMMPWSPLKKRDLLTQVHAKFWGTDMAGEEQRWRDSQPEIGANEGQDHDEEMNVGSDDVSGVSGWTNDEEITPGCYALDISVMGVALSKLWIHPDYIKIYDSIKKYYNDCAKIPGRAPCAIVTGQPGVGEFWVVSSNCS